MHSAENLNTTTSSNNSFKGFSISLSAPGKVILFGEHSVVYSKPALAASLGLRTYLSLVENELQETHSDKITVNLEAVKLSHCYEIEDIKNELLNDTLPPSKNPSNYTLEKPELVDHDRLLSKIERFIKNRSGSVPLQKTQYQALVALFYLLTAIVKTHNFELTPFTVTIKSDLAIGAGLGSSASFLVVLSAALLEYVKFKTRRCSVQELNPFSFANLEFEGVKPEFTNDQLEIISKWAFNAEKIIHGTPSGLDNTICTFGMMVEFKKMSPIVPLSLRYALRVILVNSMVPKDTKTLVTKVAVLKDKYPVIVGNVLNAMEEVTCGALRALRRLDEVVTESRMPLDKCDAEILETYTVLEDLTDINQNLLRSLGVSHKSLDEICSILAEKNLHGKLTGAGGGGYAFAFVPPGYRAEDLNYVVSKLTARHYEAKIADLGGPGLTYL